MLRRAPVLNPRPQPGGRAFTLYIAAYFIVVILFGHISIGEAPLNIDLGSAGGSVLFFLVWFGGGLFLLGLFQLRSDSQARISMLIGAIVGGTGLLLFGLLMSHGWLQAVGAFLFLLLYFYLCVMLGDEQTVQAVVSIAVVLVGYAIFALVFGLGEPPAKQPTPEEIKQVRKIFQPQPTPTPLHGRGIFDPPVRPSPGKIHLEPR